MLSLHKNVFRLAVFKTEKHGEKRKENEMISRELLCETKTVEIRKECRGIFFHFANNLKIT